MIAGRNDPCPCGSGKKYKRCCGAPKPDPLAEAARSVRSRLDDLEPRILRYVQDRLGEDAYDVAWNEFAGEVDDLDPHGPEIQAFVPWMLYRWVPSKSAVFKRRRTVPRTPMAGDFCRTQLDRIAPGDDEILHRITLQPFSYHEVVATEPGRTIRFQDVLAETEVTVFEQRASRSLIPGDIVFGRVVDFGDFALLVGCGAVALLPEFKIQLIDVRKSMRKVVDRIDRLNLLAMDAVLREMYFVARERVLHPAPPVLQNTDGEPMEFHTLTWKIESPHDAFEALVGLSHHETEAEIREEAILDDAGRVRRVAFAWSKAGNRLHAHWDNTVLGHIVIDGSKLTIEVNSVKRAKRIRAEIAKRFAGRAFGPSIKRESVEESLREQRERKRSPGGKPVTREDEEFLRTPEALEFARRHEEAHWNAWISESIPALGNKKPIQLVKTKDGREKVEALLRSFERHPRPAELGGASDMNRVRDRLGLPRRETTP